jgi:AcrR family transcriptional regulator
MSDKPLRADARRNRERVLAAAQEAFAAEGLAVPLDEIARRAGVGAGTVYRHFPTKEALFEAAVLDRVERLVALAGTLAERTDPGDAFFEFLTRLLADATVKRDLSDAVGTPSDTARLAGPAGQVRTAIDVLLTRAQQVGAVRADLRAGDVVLILKCCFAAVQTPGTDAEVTRRVFAVMLDGLRPPR